MAYRPPKRALPLLAAAACLLLAGDSAVAQTDRVRTAGGSVSGEITKITPAQIVVQRGSTSKTVPVNEVLSVQFGAEPSELNQARVNARNGGYATAIEKLNGIASGGLTNPYVKAEAAFYKAYCAAKLAQLGEGDLVAAGQALNSFVRENPSSYHYLQATELLGDLLAASGRFGPAEKIYGKLARAPFPEYKVRAGVLIGKALQAQGKHDEALTRFEAAIAGAGDTPGGKTQRLAAQLGKAVSLAATQKVDQGVELVQQVLTDADPSEQALLAAAYTALGSCYLQSGATKDALFAFLHVDLLFASQPEAHAESLFHLATLWEEIGKSAQAREARNTLKSRYKASSWAQKL